MPSQINQRPMPNIFQLQINHVRQCLTCFNNHVFKLKGQYDPCFWCKKKHQQVFKMGLEDNCVFYKNDIGVLLGDKVPAKQ